MKRIIYQNESGGVSVVIPTGELSIEEVAAKDVPEGIAYEIVEDDAIPSDRTFRGAWILGNCCIEHNIDKCREIAHDIRRNQRAEEFEPLDKVISLQLPGMDMVATEAGRQLIRKKYAEIQKKINAAKTPEEIKTILGI